MALLLVYCSSKPKTVSKRGNTTTSKSSETMEAPTAVAAESESETSNALTAQISGRVFASTESIDLLFLGSDPGDILSDAVMHFHKVTENGDNIEKIAESKTTNSGSYSVLLADLHQDDLILLVARKGQYVVSALLFLKDQGAQLIETKQKFREIKLDVSPQSAVVANLLLRKAVDLRQMTAEKLAIVEKSVEESWSQLPKANKSNPTAPFSVAVLLKNLTAKSELASALPVFAPEQVPDRNSVVTNVFASDPDAEEPAGESDSEVPTVVMSTASTINPTRFAPVVLSVTFSETVTGLTASDFVVTGNGAITAVSGSDAVYTCELTPSGDGAVAVHLAAGSVTDAAGNANTVSNEINIVYDTTAPDSPLVTATTPTNSTKPTWLWTAGANGGSGIYRYKLDDSDLTVGAAASNATMFSPAADLPDGTYTLYVQESDAAGNWSTAGSKTVVVATVPPTIVITSSLSGPTSTTPIPVTITFSQAVSNFTAADITVSGGGSVSIFAGSGTTYTFQLVPSGNGVKTVAIAQGVAQDSAGNGNVAAGNFTITYDSSVPATPVVTVGQVSPTSDTTPTWNWTSGGGGGSGAYRYRLDDADLSTGAATTTTATTYTPAAPLGAGSHTLYVQERSAPGVWSSSGSAAFSIDTTAPTLSIASTSADPTNVSPIPYTVTFLEAVSGFVAGDIAVSGGSVGNFSGSGATFTFQVTPSGDGTITVDVAAGVAMDDATNANIAAAQHSIIYDATPPSSPTVSGATPTNDTTPTWSWSAGGGGNGNYRYKLDSSDLTSGATATTATPYTPASALTTGNHTLFVQERDALGNWSTSGSHTITIDTTAPTVAVTTAASDPTNTAPIAYTITFSKSVADFVMGDITAGGGSLSGFAGSGTTYTVNLTPSGSGTITVDVAAGVATDSAGNPNTAATQNSLVYDITPPTNPSVNGTTPRRTQLRPGLGALGAEETGHSAINSIAATYRVVRQRPRIHLTRQGALSVPAITRSTCKSAIH